MSNDILGKIATLSANKRLIKDAIYAKGVKIKDDDPFSVYPDKIKDIPTESTTTTEQVLIEKNGRYDLDIGKAYDHVTVNVMAKTSKKTVTENGFYKAEDDGADGYSEFTVNVKFPDPPKPNLKEKKIASEDLPDQIAPATFIASDDNVDGYSVVTFDPRGKFGQKEIEVDSNNSSAKTTIYDAPNDNLYGYSRLVINILENRGPFNVEFWSENTRLKTVSVEKNQKAEYTGELPKKEGYSFTGWNPDPINVTENMRCYAEFEPSSTSHVDSETHKIKSTWKEIAKNGGGNIPLGSTIKLSFAKTNGGEGFTISGGTLTFMKVYEGECGTTSTWVSTTGMPVPSNGIKWFDGDNYGGWKESKIRQLLNGPFLSSISVMTKEEDVKESAAIVSAIKSVTKYTRSVAVDIVDTLNNSTAVSAFPIIPNQMTQDKIWVVSAQELGRTGMETDGVSYADTLKFSGSVLTRSIGTCYTQCIDVKNTDKDDWDYTFAGQCIGYGGGFSWFGSGASDGYAFGWHNSSYTDMWYQKYHDHSAAESFYPHYQKSSILIGFCT